MSPSVVICDDSPSYRVLLRTVLDEAGWRVVGEAATAQEALEQAERERPGLVTLDYVNTGFTGAVVRRLRDAGCSVAILSGWPGVTAPGVPADALVSKDLPLPDLVAALGAAIGG